MPFRPDLVRGLLHVKNLQQDQVVGVSRGTITKCLNGHKKVSLDDAERMAVALDATIDYLTGIGDQYSGPAEAAAHMAFAVFERDPQVSAEQIRRCRRVLEHEHAPKTADGWRAFSTLVDIAIGPAPPRIGAVRGA